MALLAILQFPDPRLKLVAKPVVEFDDSLRALCSNLLETMYEHNGVGLAATQANVQLRVFVMDISENRNHPICCINPEIISAHGEVIHEEGCLSFPGIFAKIKRHEYVKIEYYDIQGKKHCLNADALNAICVQHEIDHLNGISFYDHLSTLKQKIIRRKLAKAYDKIL